MDAQQFKQWRKSLGFSQKAAAEALGVSSMSIQLYERGFRHDDNRPVIIPPRIALACEALANRQSQALPTSSRLPYMKVSKSVLERIAAFARGKGVEIEPIPNLAYHAAHFAPFSKAIDEWLGENVLQTGYVKLVVPDAEAEGDAVVVLHFFDQNDAFSFVMSFGGRSSD